MKTFQFMFLGVLLATLPRVVSAQTNSVTNAPTVVRTNSTSNRPAPLTEAERTANAARKEKMSADELAWEKVLEANLGGFYHPTYVREKLAGKETAWDYVKDDPKLPRVLLIGDSISRGYTLAVRHALAGKANVHRAPENCGPTSRGLEKLDLWLQGGPWDVIHFNFGIHDRAKTAEEYSANLKQIVGRLKKTGADLIWARTTPAPAGPNAEHFTDALCDKLNRAADNVMSQESVRMNDLWLAVKPRLAELQLTNNVHFSEAGYEVLGKQVSEKIQSALRPGGIERK